MNGNTIHIITIIRNIPEAESFHYVESYEALSGVSGVSLSYNDFHFHLAITLLSEHFSCGRETQKALR